MLRPSDGRAGAVKKAKVFAINGRTKRAHGGELAGAIILAVGTEVFFEGRPSGDDRGPATGLARALGGPVLRGPLTF